MSNLPNNIKLSPHAKQRLNERKNENITYNNQNIMKSDTKWYGKDDLIYDCALYRHSCYVTRKSNQMEFITDGNIEILYNKDTNVAITILEVKEKFKPITQFIKPEILNQIKKEQLKMKKETINVCLDCGKTAKVNKHGICMQCARRKTNMTFRGKEYIPYLQLSNTEKEKINKMQTSHLKNTVTNDDNFIKILRDCGCEISNETLSEILNVLKNTDKLKDILITIAKNTNQDAMLDLEQALNVVERKLQHNWEYNGFQEKDDIIFKNFLNWRRTLKGEIFFWKKLYQTNCIIEMQRAWNAYTQNPNDKILLAGDKIDSVLKRFQITTETISTILNTKKPFTRVFYAMNKEDAHAKFTKWISDRQLHEDKTKTTIVELKNDRKGETNNE